MLSYCVVSVVESKINKANVKRCALFFYFRTACTFDFIILEACLIDFSLLDTHQ